MADSKPINFEKLIKLMSCDNTFFNFLCKNNALFSFDTVCSVCEELLLQPDDNTATVAPTLNCNVLDVLPNF